MSNIYLLACHFSLKVCTNTDMNKTETLDKVVLFSCLLLSDNLCFERSQRLLEVLLTLANEWLDYVALFQVAVFYICLVLLNWGL